MFTDLRCVELSTHGSAAYAGRLLAAMGADVIKVEPPGGDPMRRVSMAGATAATNPWFEYLNAGKMSIVVDLASDRAPAELEALCAPAKVFITDLDPRELTPLGVSAPSSRTLMPLGLLCSITRFGWGRYRDLRGGELEVESFGGALIGTGSPDRPPLKLPLHQTVIQAGVVAATTVAAALLMEPTPRWIDIAEVGVWASVHHGPAVTSAQLTGRDRKRSGRHAEGQPFPHCLFRCSDGWIAIQASERDQFAQFVEMLGHPTWLMDRKFGSRLDMGSTNAAAVEHEAAAWFEGKSRAEVFDACRRHRIPAAPVRSIAEVLGDQSLMADGALVTSETSEKRSVTLPSFPAWFGGKRIPQLHRAPMLDEHSRVLRGADTLR